MSQSTASERTTAALSALAALLILGAAVTADQSRSVPSSRITALESDLRFQINLAHRLNGETLRARLAEVDATLAAWRDAPQTGDDYRLLVEWFNASIFRSLPGESGELPPTPKFGVQLAPVAAAPPAPRHPPIASASAPAAQPIPSVPQPAAKPVPGKTPTPTPIAATPKPRPKPAQQPAPAQQPTAPERSIAHQAPTPTKHSAPPAPHPATPTPARSASAERAPATPVALASAVAKPIEINLAELNSRITGYHESVKSIESTLVANREQLTQQRLGEIVERLEGLVSQYSFIALYYDALSANERRAVAAPRSLEATVELVQRQLAHLEHGGEADVLSAFEAPTSNEQSSLAARLQAVAARARDAAPSAR